VLTLGKHTITNLLATAGKEFEDWTSSYRLFEQERIDRKALFAPIRAAAVKYISSEEPMVVMMDDTLIHKRGRKVYGAAWRRDPLGPAWYTNFIWGQRFLQLSAALPEQGGEGRAVGIPIDFVHAPSAVKPRKNAPPEVQAEYLNQQSTMKLGVIASQRLRHLREQTPDKQIVCAVDGGYTNKTVFREVPKNTILIGRIRKDARLYKVPEECEIQRGRKKYYGAPLPTPEEIRQDNSVPWQKVEAFAAGKRHSFEIKTISATRWRSTGERDVRLVVIRPLAYRPRKGAKLLYRDPAYLLCTDPALPLDKLLQAYLWRWEIELNFRDEKTVMGTGEAHVRTRSSVENVPPLVVAAYACLLLASTATNCKATSLPRPKWYPAKPTERCSTQQMIALFRTQLWGIAIRGNKTHFANSTAAYTNGSFYKHSLSSAVCHARK
jgi:hypothetical protein